ncbi:hypothetical protein I553_10516 [Mycobacterium xenopi 4042]|uniref:Uncharacterized protein n=1 Tax=Mycobacterium xenopi 4042 TaxID=1299334 RepID=X8DK14_MYCXE|nr:hypothetical protein I553_10516 [Mycobacterium xenopi 4042]
MGDLHARGHPGGTRGVLQVGDGVERRVQRGSQVAATSLGTASTAMTRAAPWPDGCGRTC